MDAWRRLDEIRVPVTVACGELDVPFLIARSSELADRLPSGATVTCPGWRTSRTWSSPARWRTWCSARSQETERFPRSGRAGSGRRWGTAGHGELVDDPGTSKAAAQCSSQ